MRLGRGLEYGGNITWSLDFVSDSLANGRRIKCLTIADDFSHECVDIAVDLSMPAAVEADAAAPAGFGPHYPVAAGLDDHYVLGQQLVSTIKRQRIAVELLQKDQLFQSLT